MSLTDNECTTIREYIKQLKECAEFLSNSADDVEKDLKEPPTSASTLSSSSSSASSQTCTSDKKEHRKEYDRIRKCMKKIYKEAKQKVHNIGRTLKDNDENNVDTSSVAEEDNLDDTLNSVPQHSEPHTKTAMPVNGGLESEASNAEAPKENGSTTPDPKLDVKMEEGKPSKIRLVAIEKLLDPKVMASSASSRMKMLPRELTPPPPFAASNIDTSVIILDSDDEPEPTSTNNATKGGVGTATRTIEKAKSVEQVLPKVKPVKIRIPKCKVLEKLVKADKRKIMVSKFHSKSRSKNDGSDRYNSKRRRVGSLAGDEDSEKEVDSDYARESQSKHDASADQSRRRRESKDSDRRNHKCSEPSTSTGHKTHSKSSGKKTNAKDGDANSVKGHRNIDDTPDGHDIESMLQKMESGDRDESASSKRSSENEKDSADHESDKENALKKSNKNKSDDAAVASSSSSDEAIINIKRKVVSKEANSNNSDNSSDEEIVKKKHSTRRRRIRTLSGSDSDKSENAKSSDDDDDDESDDGKKKKNRKKEQKKSDDEDNDETPTKRKNIRTVIKTKNLDDDTKKAAEAEKERRKRMEERQIMYNKLFEKPESTEIASGVLDFDPETKDELLSIDKGLLKKLKPHQFQGVKYMWDACFETIKDIQSKPGTGCILGHCMGLGKTLQVVTLSHTLLANSDKTHVNTVLVITPLSTVTNWANEFHMWMKFCKYKDIEIYDMSKYKDKKLRAFKLKEWHEDGGVCIIGYDMYRILANPKSGPGKSGKKMKESLQESLLDPGPDLVVCDEGHLLKNEKTSISQAVSRIRTQRRIVLSGTPLQNNLKEYYCMVQFVKPNLLGTYKEYLNRFVNPITNGQYTDSTERDTRLMKNRSHVLHKMLEGCIQRRDYSVLAPYLPPKHEYVIFIGHSELQRKLYEYYMQNERSTDTGSGGKGTALFKDFQNLRRIWTHPMSLRVNSDEVKKKKERKALLEEDDDDMDDFIVEEDTSESEAESTNSDTETSCSSSRTKKAKGKNSASKRPTRQNPCEDIDIAPEEEEEVMCESEWWKSICSESELKNIHNSPKLLLLFHILQEAEKIGDKVLLFSQSLQSLAVIESFLALIDKKTHGVNDEECDVNGFVGSWSSGLDYFRLDGSNSVESREMMCKRFNNKSNYRARLFLISTRAGSLGINLVAANRVIIFDASWNPSHDTQSIFRVYRFGQEKPSYIYRFIAKGTMEEKIYERQVTKQATAKRVIDEHQIGRHYNSNDLMELYQYDLNPPEVREVPILPKDRLFAELIKKHEQYVIKYHEHDSLLENKETETLSEEERKAAWSEYENEKNQPAAQYVAYRAPNYRNGPPMTSSKIFGFRTDVLLRLLNLKVRRDHPHLNDTETAQLVPLYLRQLYEQMNAGILTLYNELSEFSRAFEAPAAFGINPMSGTGMTNYVLNPFAQAPTQSAEPAYIHEID